MSSRTQEGYNGPDKEVFLDTLADYEELRFTIAQAMSKTGKLLDSWEKVGGAKDDIRDGFKLRRMDPGDQQAELRRQFRVAGWLGIVDEDRTGQASFLRVFDVKTKPQAFGIGGAPMGSRLSVVRAKSAGFNDGKTKNGPGLQEGLKQFEWDPDSDEALSYAEGFGQGLMLRPAPKVRKEDQDDGPAGDDAPPAAGVEVAPKRGPGRPRKQAALAAPESPPPESPARSVQSIWDGESDGPIH